jgi:very-short-patch-repair endonuclease
MSDIIVCRLDDRAVLLKHLSRHLKLHHGVEYKAYIKDYIEDFKDHGWNLCTVCGYVVKGTACAGACLKQHYSKTRKGVPKGPMSEETKRKLSLDRKRKYANGWAPRVGKPHSNESKVQMSKTQMNRLSDPKNHPFYGCNLSPEHKKKISETRLDRGVAKGEKNPMYGKTHTPESVRKIFSHRKMNNLEKLVAEQLDSNDIPYHFQFFIVKGGICKSYDFKIEGKPLILEIDGDFWHGNPSTKNHYDKASAVRKNDDVKTQLAEERGYKVIRLWESDIKKDPTIVLKHVLGDI